MAAALPDKTRKDIEQALSLPGARTKVIALSFGVSWSVVKNIKKRLNESRKQDGIKNGEPQNEPDLVPQPHGGALLPGGKRGQGRPKGSTKATLTSALEFLSEIDPDSKDGLSYLETFMKGCVSNAIKGNERYASMIFEALRQGDTAKLTLENAIKGETVPADGPAETVTDPLFSVMDDERLRLEAIRVLEARHHRPIEAEITEVHEA